MTWYQIAGDWQQFTALVQEKWDKLTDDDLTTFGGQTAPSPRTSSSKNTAMRENRRKKK